MWRRKKKKGFMLIYCGFLEVYGKIYGLMVRFLGGGLDVVMVVAFAHLRVASDGLHFHVFCYSKHLKMFLVKIFTVEIFLH